MPTSKPSYPAQFRQQIVKLVQAGRKPSELAKKFGGHVTTILHWVRHAGLSATVAKSTRSDAASLNAAEVVGVSQALGSRWFRQ